MKKNSHTNKAFTLIELAVVILIIGLVVSGILLGRDMITASEIRATVGQLEKYNRAVNLFQTKYTCLPGDCSNAVTQQLGTSNALGQNGNGNNKIGGDKSSTVEYTEVVNVWVHLVNAGLMVKDADMADWLQAQNGLAYDTYAPTPKFQTSNGSLKSLWWIVHGSYFSAFNRNGHLFWLSSNIGSGTTNSGSNGVTPSDALALDGKLDDGYPTTGNVQAATDGNANPFGPVADSGSAGTNVCVTSDTTPAAYGFSATTAKCSLVVQASF